MTGLLEVVPKYTISNLQETRKFDRVKWMVGEYKYYKGGDRKALQALLRDHGFYSTEGRLQLLSFLKKTSAPISVPEVCNRIGKNLVEANVYRALEALSAASILVRRDMRQGGAHYEYPHSHHHHLICGDCGRTEDVEYCDARRIENKVLENSRTFAKINTHSLEFFGHCKDCVPA